MSPDTKENTLNRMKQPFPKNSLESGYRLVADISELLLMHNVPLHQYNPLEGFLYPTPCKAEAEADFNILNGSSYMEDPNNASVVPSDVLDRLADAIQALAELEQSYWNEK